MRDLAVVFTGPDQVSVRTIDMPDPKAGEVQIRTEYSTISAGTEGWVLQDLFTWSRTKYPCVPGYQRTGVVLAVGEGVKSCAPGDRVMATVGSWSGEVVPFWGSHAHVANTAASEVYRLPNGTDPIDASCAVVAQVGYNAASRPLLEPGDWVVVYGDGMIGQCGAQVARARGAHVILVGHRAVRLEAARTWCADAVVNGSCEPVVDRIREIVGSQYVRTIVDTIQREPVQREYIDLLEIGHGQVVYSGFTPGAVWADMALLQQRELTAHFVSGWTRPRMEATLQLMADQKLRVRPLITHQRPADQAPALYRMIREKSEPFLGVTIDWLQTPQ